MAKKKAGLSKALTAIPVGALKPVIRPIIEPVIMRLDRHEDLLQAMKGTLREQSQRIAELQAEMDQLRAARRNRS